jgi:hypothetical protein
VHEKPTSPPRKAPAKSSILQKGKKKVEEVASKAKDAVTSNGHAEEPTKTEPTDGVSAHNEAPEEPVVGQTAESGTDSAAQNVEQSEPTRAVTPAAEGEASAVDLQTPHLEGESVR